MPEFSVVSIGAVLTEADSEAKALLYNEIGFGLTFDAKRRLVEVQASPVHQRSCRRGDLNAAVSGDKPYQCVPLRAGQRRFSRDARTNPYP